MVVMVLLVTTVMAAVLMLIMVRMLVLMVMDNGDFGGDGDGSGRSNGSDGVLMVLAVPCFFNQPYYFQLYSSSNFQTIPCLQFLRCSGGFWIFSCGLRLKLSLAGKATHPFS